MSFLSQFESDVTNKLFFQRHISQYLIFHGYTLIMGEKNPGN